MVSKSEHSKKLKLAKEICDEECGLLYLEEDIDVAYDHYSSEVETIFLKEHPDTVVRVTHEAVKHIADKIKKLNKRWQLGLIVTRPEMFSYNEDVDDE